MQQVSLHCHPTVTVRFIQDLVRNPVYRIFRELLYQLVPVVDQLYSCRFLIEHVAIHQPVHVKDDIQSLFHTFADNIVEHVHICPYHTAILVEHDLRIERNADMVEAVIADFLDSLVFIPWFGILETIRQVDSTMELECCSRHLLVLKVKIDLIVHLDAVLFESDTRRLIFRSQDQADELPVGTLYLISVLGSENHRNISQVRSIVSVCLHVEIHPSVLDIDVSYHVIIGKGQHS